MCPKSQDKEKSRLVSKSRDEIAGAKYVTVEEGPDSFHSWKGQNQD